MKHGVGGCTHGNVKRHGIEESLTGGYGTRQDRVVAVLIVCERILHNLACSILEKLDTVDMGCQYRAVSRQGKSDSLCQRVHGIGSEHAGAGTATGACTALYLSKFLITDRRVAALNHGSNQVGILTFPLSCLHRAAGNEHRRDVKTHGCHKHTRSDLVTIRDANHGIRLMGIDHILNGISDDIT